MTKKKYIKPAMQIVELRQRTTILNTSYEDYGVNRTLFIEDEVDDGW